MSCVNRPPRIVLIECLARVHERLQSIYLFRSCASLNVHCAHSMLGFETAFHHGLRYK